MSNDYDIVITQKQKLKIKQNTWTEYLPFLKDSSAILKVLFKLNAVLNDAVVTTLSMHPVVCQLYKGINI